MLLPLDIFPAYGISGRVVQISYLTLPVIYFILRTTDENPKWWVRHLNLKSPPLHHPVWKIIHTLRKQGKSKTKISVRLADDDSFGVVSLGYMTLRRIFIFIPARGAMHKRDYSRRRFSVLLPAIAHELGHTTDRTRHLVRRATGVLEISCYAMALCVVIEMLQKSFQPVCLVISVGICIRIFQRISDRSDEYIADSHIKTLLGKQGVRDAIEDLTKEAQRQKGIPSFIKWMEWLYDHTVGTHPSVRSRIWALRLSLES